MSEKEETIRFLVLREKKRRKALDRTLEKARSDFDSIVSFIIEEFHPSSIWQWGSLLNRDHFSEASDVDIAVEGLSSTEDVFRILEKAEQLTDFPVDVVELEKIEPSFRELIMKKGICVYGCE